MEQKEYIERDAALNVVNGWHDQLITTYGQNDEYVKCLETVAEHLESLSAADVRPVVHGRWKAVNFHTVKCPICGFEMDIMKVDDHILNHANFCTNCGADMREEP